ncbi:MAG: hypothetical protein AB7V26_04510 [Lysobacterales bacterium]
MPNVIAFLESLGRDAALRQSGKTDLDALIAAAGFDPATRSALADADVRQLGELLGARPIMVCSMETPDDEEPDDDTEDEDEDDCDDKKRAAHGTDAAIH